MEAEGPLPCSQKLPTSSSLDQINPVHAPNILFKLHFNIIFASMSRFTSHERSHFSRYKTLVNNKKKLKYFFNVIIAFIPVTKEFKIFERVNRCQV